MKALLRFLCFLLMLCSPLHADDVIERWNMEFLAAVKRQAPPPCLVARNLAILHLAIWRAVKDAEEGNEATAASGAAHEVCTVLFSGDRAGFDRLLKTYPAKGDQALEAGRSAARKTLGEREGDGSNTTVHYSPKLAVGIWQRTTNNRPPELPHWGMVKPFVLESGEMFRPPPPPACGSADYAADVNEVKTMGGKESPQRTQEEELIAHFWSDFSYTSSPVGRWNEIGRNALVGRNMSLREKARLFAVLNVTLADTAIAAWDCKYHYRFWRPISAIHEIFDDGNMETKPDKNWQSLLPAPSHPEYVSGHSTFSAAGAFVLHKELGQPIGKIIVENTDMPGVTRTFESFEEIANEAGQSRIFGGIHFTAANKQGAVLGKKVAEEVRGKFDGMY